MCMYIKHIVRNIDTHRVVHHKYLIVNFSIHSKGILLQLKKVKKGILYPNNEFSAFVWAENLSVPFME